MLTRILNTLQAVVMAVRRFFKAIIYLVFIFFSPVHLFAQGFPVNKEYDISEFDAFQQAWDLAQDSSGIIYVAHGSGILRFDGVRWETKHGEESKHVHRLFEGSDGRIYYGSESSFGYLDSDSLNRFRFQELSSFVPDTILIGDIYDIHEVHGNIYFTSLNGFFIWDNISVRYLRSKFELGRSFAFKDQIITKRLDGGLYYFNQDNFILIDRTQLFSEDYIYAFLEIQGGAFIASRNNGFFLFQDGEITKIENEIDPLIQTATPFRAERILENRIAVATLNSGVIIIDNEGKVIEKFDLEEEITSGYQLRNNMVLGLMIDNSSQLWVATLNGINRLNISLPVRYFDRSSGIFGSTSSINFYNNKIYIGTQNGLFATDYPLNWKSSFSRILNNSISELFSTKRGLWISSSEGVQLIKEKEIQKLNTNNALYLTVVDDEVYYTDGSELFYIDVNGRTNSTGVKGNFFRISYNKGYLWIIDRNSGIRILSPRDFSEKIIRINEIPESTTINFIGLINDIVRIGTDVGLYSYEEASNSITKDKSFNDQTLVNKQVHLFHQISDDTLWFRNNLKDRLFIKKDKKWISADSLYSILSKDAPPLDVNMTSSGFWVVSPREVKRISNLVWEYKTDFKTNITDIYVNRDSLIYGGFGEPVKPIIFPYKDNEVRFNYAAASYIDETRNTYSYKLEGFDNKWSEWSLETQKDYTNIPEGEYIFKVRSKNVFEVDGRPDQIAFTILPPWYRTWWAYMLYFISFSGLLYTGYKVRVNQLLKVERMRNKIASDLHDEVSATLTGISYFAEAIKRDKDQSKAAHFVSLISESAGDAKEKITDIVWSINPENDSWELFLSKCRRFASDLLESKELEYSLNITEHVPGKLSMEVRQHLWMIYKEMITNAVRHSAASRLDVIMDIENGMLKLIVQDNGNGFDLDEIKDGNGIRNIRKRAAKIGAVIKIHSEEDFGTRWRMELPL